MIKTNSLSYAPRFHVDKFFTYDNDPVTNVREVYDGKLILISQLTPPDFFDIGNDVPFNFNTRFGWGGFYPDSSKYSDDKKIVPEHTSYKIWIGGLYEYKGEFYGYTYFT